MLHGLGSAVPRAINLALCLQVAARGPAIIDTRTSTVYLSGMTYKYFYFFVIKLFIYLFIFFLAAYSLSTRTGGQQNSCI